MQPREICLGYINFLYQESKAKRFTSNIDQTYGEILPHSVSKLLAYLNLTDQDSFLDLGAGMGKLLLQVFLESKIHTAIGIEIDMQLHEQAQLSLQKAKKQVPEFFLQRRIEFLNASFLEYALPQTTHALIASPCFTISTLDTLVRNINNINSLKTLISLRPLAGLKNLVFKRTLRIECSWDTALAYIYVI